MCSPSRQWMLEPLRRLGKFTADGAVSAPQRIDTTQARIVPSSGPSTPLSLEVVAGNGEDDGVASVREIYHGVPK